jgi:hypothetical protein
VPDDRRRIVEQLPAGPSDAFEQLNLFVTNQTIPDSTQVGPEPPDTLKPFLPEAEVHPVELVGTGQPAFGAIVDPSQCTFVPLAQPAGPRAGIDQIGSTADGRVIAALVGIGEGAQPASIHIDIVIEEGDNVVASLDDGAIACAAEPLPVLMDIPQASGEARCELLDDGTCPIG